MPTFDDPVGLSLYQAIARDPADRIARAAYRDWCGDNDPVRYELMRLHDRVRGFAVAREMVIVDDLEETRAILEADAHVADHRLELVQGPACPSCLGTGLLDTSAGNRPATLCSQCRGSGRLGVINSLENGRGGYAEHFRDGVVDEIVFADPICVFSRSWGEEQPVSVLLGVVRPGRNTGLIRPYSLPEITWYHPVQSVRIAAWVPTVHARYVADSALDLVAPVSQYPVQFYGRRSYGGSYGDPLMINEIPVPILHETANDPDETLRPLDIEQSVFPSRDPMYAYATSDVRIRSVSRALARLARRVAAEIHRG